MSGAAEGPDPRVGLCSVCAHRKLVRNRRGSEFHLCRLSERDDRFSRYPRLPVVECPGFTPDAGQRGTREGRDDDIDSGGDR